IVVRPELKTIEDLRGKTVGVSRLKAISDVGARLGLERMGLKPDVDVFTRGTGGIAESLAALEQGSVEGASLAVPALFTGQKRGRGRCRPTSRCSWSILIPTCPPCRPRSTSRTIPRRAPRNRRTCSISVLPSGCARAALSTGCPGGRALASFRRVAAHGDRV